MAMMTWDQLDLWRSNQRKEWGQSEGYTEAIKAIPPWLHTQLPSTINKNDVHTTPLTLSTVVTFNIDAQFEEEGLQQRNFKAMDFRS